MVAVSVTELVLVSVLESLVVSETETVPVSVSVIVGVFVLVPAASTNKEEDRSADWEMLMSTMMMLMIAEHATKILASRWLRRENLLMRFPRNEEIKIMFECVNLIDSNEVEFFFFDYRRINRD